MVPDEITDSDGKIAVTIEYSTDVLEAFMTAGPDWEGRMDAALKDWLKKHNPSDVKI